MKKNPKKNSKISDVVVKFIKTLSLSQPKVSIYFGKRDIPEVESSSCTIYMFSIFITFDKRLN